MKLMRACLTFISVCGIVACDSPVQPPPPPPPPPATTGQIAFSSSGSDSLQHIYVLDLDQSTVTQLTNGPANDYGPIWSPDRRQIAFVRSGDPSNSGIWLMQADGTGAVRLTSDGGGLTWSPDGTRIAFTFGNSMRIVRTDHSSDEITITHSLPGLWRYGALAWSPDGSTIAFQGTTLDILEDAFTQLYLMDVNGSNVRRLTSDCTYGTCGAQSAEGSPAWSPDGRKVAFWSFALGITVANQNGSGAFSVTKDGYAITGEPPTDGFGTGPDWSPDGNWLVFTRNGQLVVARVDGTGAVAPVTSLPGGAFSPAWSR